MRSAGCVSGDQHLWFRYDITEEVIINEMPNSKRSLCNFRAHRILAFSDPGFLLESALLRYNCLC